jgi:hypothetical protein
MVGPFKILDPLIEELIVVGSAADVDDEVFFIVVPSQIVGDIFDTIPVGLLEHFGSGVGHRNDPFRNVGEVELDAVVVGCSLGTGNYFFDQFKHRINKT